ncbi:DUF1656 domain-containing protein [Alloalcanivorax mobilis]|uniref:DUF1656 domain-containing protein n=1 Tax=Alloalcanivorax mobilis TaxID=2019569 RepID=UPI000C772094|nr:DUF1656 domain-containing protein [Alloalcanivorax mobilis]
MAMAELDIHGVFVPTFMALMLVAYVASRGLRLVLERSGFYRLVWHRALFDLALYVVLLGAFFYLFEQINA